MTLAAGRMRERVEIQAPDHLADGAAGRRTRWRRVGSVAAEVIPLTGSSGVDDVVVRDSQAWRVTIRHRSDITTGHRLMYRGTALRINAAVDPDMRRERLVMSCESGGPT